MIRSHQTICRHPQLTLAIFATPEAFVGVTRQITDRLTALLAVHTPELAVWRDILIDYAHGSGLAIAFVPEGPMRVQAMQHYQVALDRVLEGMMAPKPE